MARAHKGMFFIMLTPYADSGNLLRQVLAGIRMTGHKPVTPHD